MRRNQSDVQEVGKLDVLSTRQGMRVRHDDNRPRLQERLDFNRGVVDGQYAGSYIELLLRNPRLDVKANPRPTVSSRFFRARIVLAQPGSAVPRHRMNE